MSAFPTSYLCERAFSVLNHLKSKKRNRLNVQHQLRVKLSGYQPDFDGLIEKNGHRRSKNVLETSSSNDIENDSEVVDDDDEYDDSMDTSIQHTRTQSRPERPQSRSQRTQRAQSRPQHTQSRPQRVLRPRN